MDNLYQRERLKAKIEANRISRMGDKYHKKMLENLKEKKLKPTSDLQYVRICTLVDLLTEKINQKEESRSNQSYAEYNDGHGYGSSSGSGTDNG